MNLIKSIFLTVFILSINVLLQAETKFFRHLDKMINYEYQFKNEINSEMAEKSVCYKVDFNEHRRPVHIQFQKMGKVRIDSDNVAITIIEYSENLQTHYYFNEIMEPTYNDDENVHSLIIEKIEKNSHLVSFYDIDSKQITNTDDMFYLMINSNPKKDIFAVNTMDKNKVKIPLNNIYEKKYKYNDKKDLILITRYNRLGLLQDEGKIAITRFNRGDKVLKTLHFNMYDEQVAIAEERAAFYVYNNETKTKEFKIFEKVGGTIVKYDSNGYIASEANFSINNAYTFDRNKVCSYHYDYNENGLLLSRSNYDVDRNECEDVSGIHRYEYSYDDLGNRIEEIKIRNSKVSISYTPIIKNEFNENGMLIQKTFFKNNNKPHKVDGVFGYTFEYDQFRNISKKGYLNKKGDPALYGGSYNYLVQKFNRKNELIEISYEKIDGTLGKGEAGYSIKLYNDYNDKMTRSIEYFTGKTRDDIKLVNVNGIAKIIKTYNAQRYITKIEYFNKNNDRVNDSDGYAIANFGYDDNFETTEIAYYDKKENLTIPKDGSFAKLIKEYDHNGYWTKVEYYGKDNSLITVGVSAAITRKFNDASMITEQKYFDEDYHLLTLRGKKYTYYNKDYDHNGNMIEHSFYDTDGNLVNNKNGYAQIKINYSDVDDLIRSISFYDESGNPVISKKDKCASVKYFYDDLDQLIEIQYLNLTGELENISKGSLRIASMKFTYNSKGLKKEKHYYDKDGVFIKKFKIDKSTMKWEEIFNFFFND